MIRVFLAEDHPLFREGLRSALNRAGYEIAGETDRGANLIGLLMRTRPDLLLLDLNLADQFAPADTVRQIHAALPTLKIVVLSAHAEARWIDLMVSAGVDGYVHKGDPPQELIHGIHALIEGTQSRWFSKTIIAEMVSDRATLLDENDIHLLRAIANGKTDQRIADESAVSVRTVQRGIKSLLDRLGARTRTEAVAAAIKRGLIEL